jgi:hypothetical protein
LKISDLRFGHAEFGEDAKGGFGVEEGDEFASRAFERNLVDELAASALGLGELGGDGIGGEGDVVDAAVGVFLEEFGDGTFGRSGFEKFEMDFTAVEEGGANFLGGDFLDVLAFETEGVFVVGDGFVQALDGDAEVVDALDHEGLSEGNFSKAGRIRKG